MSVGTLWLLEKCVEKVIPLNVGRLSMALVIYSLKHTHTHTQNESQIHRDIQVETGRKKQRSNDIKKKER